MSQDDSLNELLSRLRTGDNDAAQELFDKYAGRLIGLARTRLSAPLRQKVDPEDIAQSVFKSFFRRQTSDPFDLEDWGGLWGVLVVITMRKCGRRAQAFKTARRDVRKESPPRATADDSHMEWDFPGGEPTPEEAASLTETVERLMERLDERGRHILSLRLQGYSIEEISEQIARTKRTVHRTLEQVKNWLVQEVASDAD
jgi:RNA polymerase sigma-70 factor, ECF subfamily